MEKKYELINDICKVVEGKFLYRIRALRNFGSVKRGDLGGYVESEDNLSHDGDCWIYDKATVYDKARVSDNAMIYGNAAIYGDAQVFENAAIFGNARIFGNAKIYGSAEAYHICQVLGNAEVYDSASIFNNAYVCGNAHIYGDSEILGFANIFGDAEIESNNDYIHIQHIHGNDYITAHKTRNDGIGFYFLDTYFESLEELLEMVIELQYPKIINSAIDLILEKLKNN